MAASAGSGLASRSLWRLSTTAGASSLAGRLAGEARAAYATLGGSGAAPPGGPGAQRPVRPPGKKPTRPTKPTKRPSRPRGDPRFAAPADYTSASGLAMAAARAAMKDPRGGIPYLYGTDKKGGQTPVVAVPMPPRPDAYTDMGRNVVPPRPTVFQSLPLPRPTGGEPSTSLHVRFSPQHVLHPWSMRYLEATTEGDAAGAVDNTVVAALSQFPHVLAEPTRRRYAEKNARDSLWWFVLVHAGGAASDAAPIRGIVQRSGMRRRVERAFRDALRRHGYSASGEPLSSWPVRIAEGERVPRPRRPLVGTVRIEGIVRPLLQAGFERVTQRLDCVVTALEYRQRKAARESSQERQASVAAGQRRRPEPLAGFETLDPNHF